MAYATRDDVYMTLSAQAFVVLPRPVGAAPSSLALDFNPSTGTIRLPGHGYMTSDLVYIVTTTGGSLPGGAATLTYYSPIPLGSDLFQLAATPNGTPLTFSSAGQGWSLAIDTGRRIDWHLEDTFGQINDCLTAHATPIAVDPQTGAYPPVLRGMNARMAARAAVISLQIDNSAFKVSSDRLFAQEKADKEERDDWKAGKPILPLPTDQTPTIADNAMRARGSRPIGWLRHHRGVGSGTPWH